MRIYGGLIFANAFSLVLSLVAAPSLAADAKAGKAVYEKRCISCHGADGKGNPAMVKAMGEKGLNLTTKQVTGAKDDELMKVIIEGRGKMPATKGITKDKAKEVVDYVEDVDEVAMLYSNLNVRG